MPVRRLLEPGVVTATDIRSGRVEAHYAKVLTRLLAAHALAEKLTAAGYERALDHCTAAELRPLLAKNLAEERRHAELIYGLLAELGLTEQQADRLMVRSFKSPSFEAPRYFAENACQGLDLVMASLSLDATGLLMIAINYRESSYAPHARAADLIAEEEEDHEDFAATALGDALERYGPQAMQQALAQWLPRALNFFGPPGSGFTFDCLSFGLKIRDNEELAGLYLSMVERRLRQLGLTLPRLTDNYPYRLT